MDIGHAQGPLPSGTAPGAGPGSAVAPGRRRGGEVIPVTLFEDAAGRMVVVDARGGRGACAAAPLLRLGRARLALHHLAPAVGARLEATGQVTVDGPDALNVLLAFADGVGRADAVD
jgi:hypothetical protein